MDYKSYIKEVYQNTKCIPLVHMDASDTNGIVFVVGERCRVVPVPYNSREIETIRFMADGKEGYLINRLMDVCESIRPNLTVMPNKKAYMMFFTIVDEDAVKVAQALKPVRAYNRMNSNHPKPRKK